jgi:predicted cobalt transporter CbtA
MPRARDFLVRGLLAGLIAGFAAFAVAYLVGEPSVNAAIAREAGNAAVSGGAGAAVVSRSLQSTLGLLTGTAVAGVTLGGVVGVLSALALGRFGRLSPRGTCLAVAAMGFISLYLVPFAGYPPNPPAVGSDDTLGVRTASYAVLVTISVIAAVTAVLTGRRLARRREDAWPSVLASVAGYAGVMVVVLALLPRYPEVPADFPATVLYDFRAASLLTQLTLWTVLGLVLAELVHRRLRPSAAPRALPQPAAR